MNKPDFLAKYSSNQNEPKNKDIDNNLIDIFAVNELSPESSDEDLEDENWKKPEYMNQLIKILLMVKKFLCMKYLKRRSFLLK